MVDNPYLQFPLCALSFGLSERHRLDAIIDFGCVTTGTKLWWQLSPPEQNQFMIALQRSAHIPRDFDVQIPLHCTALYGAHIIGIKFGSLVASIERYSTLQSHIEDFKGRYGRDAMVRIKKQWVFDTRDGHGLTYREFCVLCAIYS